MFKEQQRGSWNIYFQWFSNKFMHHLPLVSRSVQSNWDLAKSWTTTMRQVSVPAMIGSVKSKIKRKTNKQPTTKAQAILLLWTREQHRMLQQQLSDVLPTWNSCWKTGIRHSQGENKADITFRSSSFLISIMLQSWPQPGKAPRVNVSITSHYILLKQEENLEQMPL